MDGPLECIVLQADARFKINPNLSFLNWTMFDFKKDLFSKSKKLEQRKKVLM